VTARKSSYAQPPTRRRLMGEAAFGIWVDVRRIQGKTDGAIPHPISTEGGALLIHVGVMGGGLQGCCIAMALADRGARVTIFDRSQALLTRAAVANEGKVHLGYMYCGDPSLQTARMMIRGALAFAPLLSEWLGLGIATFQTSDPAAYVVHRGSQRDPDRIHAYLQAVHTLIQEAATGRRDSYFNADLASPIRRWPKSEFERELTAEALAAFQSPEVAIDPVALAELIRERVAATPSIEIRTNHLVTSVDPVRREITTTADGIIQREQFDHIVNSLWDGRIAIDCAAGMRPRRTWIHRLKYGVSFRPPSRPRPARSMTIVLGPFGEVVRYRNGTVYLTWYPSCVTARTFEAEPPFWPIVPDEPSRSAILEGTYSGLAAIHPVLSDYAIDELSDVVVRGGPIVAWGETDIDDPASELHRRFEIGVTSVGAYHSVDPGKLTMAPYFADECVRRIVGESSTHPVSGRFAERRAI
jgi:glycine/D-amino acid oxidase-like deaminating enzyme